MPDKRLELLLYLIGIADKQGDAVWAALFREIRGNLEKSAPSIEGSTTTVTSGSLSTVKDLRAQF